MGEHGFLTVDDLQELRNVALDADGPKEGQAETWIPERDEQFAFVLRKIAKFDASIARMKQLRTHEQAIYKTTIEAYEAEVKFWRGKILAGFRKGQLRAVRTMDGEAHLVKPKKERPIIPDEPSEELMAWAEERGLVRKELAKAELKTYLAETGEKAPDVEWVMPDESLSVSTVG